MKEQAHPYADLVAAARFNSQPADSLSAARVFYACAHFRKPQRRRVEDPVPRVRFNGKLNSIFAMCIPLESGTAPLGLRGKMIGYECSVEPEDPKRGPITGNHRGDWGVLSGEVFCTILIPFTTAT